jgi:hypothetical protein
MADVIKKQTVFQKASVVVDVPVGHDSAPAARHPRIIKSEKSTSGETKREIPIRPNASNDVMVRTLGNGPFIEGVEIRCRCGETIVIHFDYDAPESTASV